MRSLVPHRAVAWDKVVVLDVSDQACDDRRETRESSTFTLPEDTPEAVSWSQVAHWFRLDPAEVCAVNGVAAADCGGRRLEPGEHLALPLRHHALGPPSRRHPAPAAKGES